LNNKNTINYYSDNENPKISLNKPFKEDREDKIINKI
jgi:hypothetical protein